MTRHTAATVVSVARRAAMAMVLVATLPAAALAQGSITGVIRDTSGAVLPGVTVEAASPALIEKVRSVISDGTGQYRIVDLRPGVYSVTFTLPGFNTFKRDGIELAGNFTATINAELRVGALEETITVTGETPVVDTQGVTRQRVISADVIDEVPTGRNYTNLGILVPGVSTQCAQTCSSGPQDVGGASGDSRSTLTVHGSRFRDQRLAINGMTIAGSTGGLTMTGPNMEAMQEVQIETSGIDASVSTGGVRINVVPKDGGNTFGGSLFLSGTNEHFQGENVTQELKDRGLSEGAISRIKRIYDFAPTFGGPVSKDKIWFFLSGRLESNRTYIGNLYANKNAYNPRAWTYEPDLNQQITHDSPLNPVGGRITWQMSPRNKIAASVDFRDRCDCPNVAANDTSREAAADFMFKPDNIYLISYSSPVTNRLLLEGTAVALPLAWGNRINEGIDPTLIQVVEQNPKPGYPGTYRGGGGYNWTRYPFYNVALNTTYVTGAHAFKTGFNNNWGFARTFWTNPRAITSYRFSNGVPNQFTVNSDPRNGYTRVKSELGLFVQDKWTIDRLTLSGGLRYDYMNRYAPEISLGPAPLLPNRNVTFTRTDVTGHHDLSPRVGVAYDVFGTGKTAIKVTINRYVTDESLGSGTNTLNGSPFNYFQYTASRAWTDSNGNFYPDCDFRNPAAQNLTATGGDICGAFTGNNANFGLPIGGTIDDHDVDFGWGTRGFNWEFSTSVQQELVPQRVAVDVGYFRRWYGNFLVTDNRVTAATDYSPFSVTLPTDPRLPLSGKTISGFLDINPNVASLPTDNHVALSEHYGKQYEYWHGVDISLSARLTGGTLIQGGIGTGKTVTDNCEVLKKVPEGGVTTQQGLSNGLLPIAGSLAVPFCHQQTPFLTQVKGLATYTIPRLDVQLSGVFQSVPGPQVRATFVVPNAVVQPSLGRPLSGGAANVTVPIVEAGALYGDRLQQLDFRVGKIIRFGGSRRMTPSVDIYNLLNSSAVLAEAETYSSFRVPARVVGARLVKFSLSMNF
jgi:Carboxypeptidase regulatory-like domain